MLAFTFHTKLVSQHYTEAQVLLSCFHDCAMLFSPPIFTVDFAYFRAEPKTVCNHLLLNLFIVFTCVSFIWKDNFLAAECSHNAVTPFTLCANALPIRFRHWLSSGKGNALSITYLLPASARTTQPGAHFKCNWKCNEFDCQRATSPILGMCVCVCEDILENVLNAKHEVLV